MCFLRKKIQLGNCFDKRIKIKKHLLAEPEMLIKNQDRKNDWLVYLMNAMTNLTGIKVCFQSRFLGINRAYGCFKISYLIVFY